MDDSACFHFLLLLERKEEVEWEWKGIFPSHAWEAEEAGQLFFA